MSEIKMQLTFFSGSTRKSQQQQWVQQQQQDQQWSSQQPQMYRQEPPPPPPPQKPIKQQDNYNRKIKAWSSGPGNNTRTVQESSSNTTPIYGARGQPQGFKSTDSYNYEMTAVTEFQDFVVVLQYLNYLKTKKKIFYESVGLLLIKIESKWFFLLFIY